MEVKRSGSLQKGNQMPYHKIMYDNDYEGGQVIGDYVMGLIDPTIDISDKPELLDKVFNPTVFWMGKPFSGKIPDFVKLIIKSEDENEEQLDLLPNPVSWLIFSERLTEFAYPLLKDDVQIFDPPIYRESDGAKVGGYKLINPVHSVDCLDLEKTKVTRAEDGHIKFCSSIHIKEERVGYHHLFRIKDYFPPIMISDKLAKAIRKEGFTGFAFLRCGVS
jgi:hypothetical protein